jgi:multiple sugar transport system permease protein
MNHYRRKCSRAGLWFALPALVGVLGLVLLPMVMSFALSLTEWNGLSLSDIHYVGAGNYRALFALDHDRALPPGAPWWWRLLGGAPRNELFFKALNNSLVFSAVAVPLSVAAALGLALLLNRRLPGAGLFRSVYYLPHILGGVATIMMWQWMFNPDFGWINSALRGLYGVVRVLAGALGYDGTFHPPVPDWLFSPNYAKPALIIIHAWSAGGAMLIFLAALQGVPAELLEAARLDGAGRWRRLRHVILPHLTPAILFNLLVGFIGCMQSFSYAYLLSHWSQRDSLLFYVLHLYRKAFEDYEFGVASAMAWVLFALLFVLTVLTLRSSRYWVYYAGSR